VINKNNQKVELLKSILEQLQNWKGQNIEIREQITRSADIGYNRHFCTTSSFQFKLEHSGWTVSGGRLFLIGYMQA